MRRRQSPIAGRRDATRAMKAALQELARSRGNPGSSYPECIRRYADVRDEAEIWVTEGVRGAIDSGCTWAEVGQALGVSRQAAHERYAPLIMARAKAATEDPN